MGLHFLVMVWSLHFLLLKARPEAADLEDRLSRSGWRAVPSSSDITTFYTLVPSANIATLLLRIESGRLFTYIKKGAGPSIEPCGTPKVTGRSLDVAPSTVTHWRLPQRYMWNHVSRFPLKPASRSFSIRRSCLTLSKALDMSNTHNLLDQLYQE